MCLLIYLSLCEERQPWWYRLLHESAADNKACWWFRPGSCERVDSVAVSVPLANGPRIIGIFCGSKRPPRLMSTGVNLDVTFVSHVTSSTSSARGFTAIYNFVTGQSVKTWSKLQPINASICDTPHKSQGKHYFVLGRLICFLGAF